MASAAEQLASNLNFAAFAKAEDLKKRIVFTVLALLVYRLGTYIPLPGINPQKIAEMFSGQVKGILGMVDMFAGGAIQRMAIFGLGIMPYISASIIMQLMTTVIPSLEALKKEGEQGRKIINQYTRYGTLLLAVVQAYGLAIGLEAGEYAINPGWFFRISTVLTFAGGTMFLMWLGEQITSRGIGNGISLIIFAGIVANLPHALRELLSKGKDGTLPAGLILGILVLLVLLIAGIVLFERAQRRLLIQYPKRQEGNRLFQGNTSHLPLKLNTAGVIPPIFASSLLLLPATAVGFTDATKVPGWMTTIIRYFSHGNPVYMCAYAGLILFFAFFYTAIVFNPKDTADQLKKHSGFIPGYRPGERTAEYIDYVLTRITVIGALYLVFICLVPEVLMSYMSLPFYLGGTSLLIVVSVTLDTVAQIQGHLIAHQYEGLIRKSKLRGGKRGK